MFRQLWSIGAVILVAGLMTAFPAWANGECPEGTSEVTVDIGSEIRTICADDEVLDAAKAGDPITIEQVSCPCNYVAILDPKRMRNYDAGGTPVCSLQAGGGLILSGLKAKPDSKGATRIQLTVGEPPSGLCRLFATRNGTIVRNTTAFIATVEQEQACFAAIDAYRAAVPNDEYAALTCPGF